MPEHGADKLAGSISEGVKLMNRHPNYFPEYQGHTGGNNTGVVETATLRSKSQATTSASGFQNVRRRETPGRSSGRGT